jgi:hypothetical protein
MPSLLSSPSGKPPLIHNFGSYAYQILHRNDMFELSRRLIGIYKTNNATRSEPSSCTSLML